MRAPAGGCVYLKGKRFSEAAPENLYLKGNKNSTVLSDERHAEALAAGWVDLGDGRLERRGVRWRPFLWRNDRAIDTRE